MKIHDNLQLVAGKQLHTLAALAENFKNFHARRLTSSILKASGHFHEKEKIVDMLEKFASSACTKRIS